MPLNHAEHWQWRLHMAQVIAAHLDGNRFGVVACYIFGSTKNATAGPASDIDLLIHTRNTQAQQAQLHAWLQGWGLCLAEINAQKTGEHCDSLLDLHYITDADIAQGDSFAVKIGAVTDGARPLPLMSTH